MLALPGKIVSAESWAEDVSHGQATETSARRSAFSFIHPTVSDRNHFSGREDQGHRFRLTETRVLRPARLARVACGRFRATQRHTARLLSAPQIGNEPASFQFKAQLFNRHTAQPTSIFQSKESIMPSVGADALLVWADAFKSNFINDSDV